LRIRIATAVSTFRPCPCAPKRVEEFTANRPFLVNASYLWCDRLQHLSNRLLPSRRNWLTHGEEHRCSTRVPGFEALAPVLFQRSYSRTSISRRSGAAVPSSAALVSAQRSMMALCTDLMGLGLHASIAARWVDWPPTCRLISSYGYTDGGGLQRHRVASCTFASSETFGIRLPPLSVVIASFSVFTLLDILLDQVSFHYQNGITRVVPFCNCSIRSFHRCIQLFEKADLRRYP